ncbi:7177_t:CDS:2, partial [Scutellospora calospora]
MTSQLDRRFGQLRQVEELNAAELARDEKLDTLKRKKSGIMIKNLRNDTYSSSNEYMQEHSKFSSNLKNKHSQALLSRSPPLNNKSVTLTNNGKLRQAVQTFPHIETSLNGSNVNNSKSLRHKSSTKNMFGASSESDSDNTKANSSDDSDNDDDSGSDGSSYAPYVLNRSKTLRTLPSSSKTTSKGSTSPTGILSQNSSTNKLNRAKTYEHDKQGSSKNIQPRELIEKEKRNGTRDRNDDDLTKYRQKDREYTKYREN